MKLTDKLTITNEDNMELMKRYPDNYFDLAIVDPPYGIGMDGTIGVGIGKEKGFTRKKEYHKKSWDKEVPSQEYFDELFRVSKNQIVWGANYFTKQLPILKNYIFWYKKGRSKDELFNEGEMAFTSIGRTVMVDIWWNGVGVINSGEKKVHPTQKPVALYKWLLDKYAKVKCSNIHCVDGIVDIVYNEIQYCCECQNREPFKILDTHLGSGSIAIACHDYGFELTACELDAEYYEKAIERIKNHVSQLTMF